VTSSLTSLSLLAAALVAPLGCASAEKEENEVVMKLEEVPTAVREGLVGEAGGGAIDKVDKEMANGTVLYEVDVMQNGKNWEIKVDESGNLVSKRLD